MKSPNQGPLACTAVPIEINHHEEMKHMAVVTFLSRDEWEDELTTLLNYFRDEGNITDLDHCSDIARATRDKVRSDYDLQ